MMLGKRQVRVPGLFVVLVLVHSVLGLESTISNYKHSDEDEVPMELQFGKLSEALRVNYNNQEMMNLIAPSLGWKDFQVLNPRVESRGKHRFSYNKMLVKVWEGFDTKLYRLKTEYDRKRNRVLILNVVQVPFQNNQYTSSSSLVVPPQYPYDQYQHPPELLNFKKPKRPHKKPGKGSKRPSKVSKKPGKGSKRPGKGMKKPGKGMKKPGKGMKKPSKGMKKPKNPKPLKKPQHRPKRPKETKEPKRPEEPKRPKESHQSKEEEHHTKPKHPKKPKPYKVPIRPKKPSDDNSKHPEKASPEIYDSPEPILIPTYLHEDDSLPLEERPTTTAAPDHIKHVSFIHSNDPHKNNKVKHYIVKTRPGMHNLLSSILQNTELLPIIQNAQKGSQNQELESKEDTQIMNASELPKPKRPIKPSHLPKPGSSLFSSIFRPKPKPQKPKPKPKPKRPIHKPAYYKKPHHKPVFNKKPNSKPEKKPYRKPGFYKKPYRKPVKKPYRKPTKKPKPYKKPLSTAFKFPKPKRPPTLHPLLKPTLFNPSPRPNSKPIHKPTKKPFKPLYKPPKRPSEIWASARPRPNRPYQGGAANKPLTHRPKLGEENYPQPSKRPRRPKKPRKPKRPVQPSGGPVQEVTEPKYYPIRLCPAGANQLSNMANGIAGSLSVGTQAIKYSNMPPNPKEQSNIWYRNLVPR